MLANGKTMKLHELEIKGKLRDKRTTGVNPIVLSKIRKDALPRLEQDAINRGLAVERDIRVPRTGHYGDIVNMKSGNADIAIALPRIMLRGKVPFDDLKLVVRLTTSNAFVLVYDHGFHSGNRAYPHPHSYPHSPYICSRDMAYYMANYLIEGNERAMIPYAIRVVDKGLQDGAHYSLAGIPWCGNCQRWVGDDLESPMDFAPTSSVQFKSGDYHLATEEFVEHYKSLEWVKIGCGFCLGSFICAQCSKDKQERICNNCGKEKVCRNHSRYTGGLCKTCWYKRQGE